jgi:hypothetical protein
MRIHDFARPETMIRAAAKMFAFILALLLLPSLLQVLVRAIPGLAVVLGIAIASFVAYAARQREGRGPGRSQRSGGAERTPVLPTIDEDF